MHPHLAIIICLLVIILALAIYIAKLHNRMWEQNVEIDAWKSLAERRRQCSGKKETENKSGNSAEARYNNF